MKITPISTGKSEFLRIFNEAKADVVLIEKADPSRLYNLRCSQLPYCPTSVILNYGLRGLHQPMDMAMAYYVSVGHAVHHVMQRYLSQTGKFLANYHCKECGKTHKLSHKIECCGFETQYDEIELSFKGVKGHIDAVFKDRQGRYWIVDFKTCTLEGANSKSSTPPDGYMAQVRSYAYLLRAQYKITVAGVMLVFLPRDNPWNPTVWEKQFTPRDFEKAKAMLIEERRKHRLTMKASTMQDLKELFKYRCTNSYCKYCSQPFSDLLTLGKRALKKLPIMKGQDEHND